MSRCPLFTSQHITAAVSHLKGPFDLKGQFDILGKYDYVYCGELDRQRCNVDALNMRPQ